MLWMDHRSPMTTELTKVSIGGYAPDFEIRGVDDEVHHLSRYLQSHRGVVVVFMCNHCPYVRAYLERLLAIQADYAPQITLIGINANDEQQFPEDSFERMKTFAQEQGITFPYLRDSSQDVARCFGAERTPEVFLIDAQGVVRYTGRIDDSPQDPAQVTASDLRQALDQLLGSNPITVGATEAIGCSIKWRP